MQSDRADAAAQYVNGAQLRYSITLHRDSPGGPVVAHLGPYATACKWSDNEHGNRDLSATLPRVLADAFRLYASPGNLWLAASTGATQVWAGLLDEPSLWADADESGVTVRALGRWSALDDLTYTALWSDTRVSEWVPVSENDIGIRVPGRFSMDTNNRLSIGLVKNNNYAGANGALVYKAPYGGSRKIVSITLTYSFIASADFTARVNSYNEGFTAPVVEWSLVGNGALQTATITVTLATPKDYVVLELANSGVTYTGETDAHYLRTTNPRIKTTSSATVTAEQIVADLAAGIAALNASTLASATPIATATGMDLRDLVFEDAAPTDILDQLGAWGNGSGIVYTAAVDQDGYLTFRPRGTGGRTWYVDVEAFEIATARGDLANSIYAVFKEPSGRSIRTVAATDAASVTRYGRTRRQSIAADTTSATIAGQIRDTALSDRATVSGAASLTIRRCAAAGGGPADPAQIRPGDTLIARNFPLLGGGVELDQLRAFRVGERSYDPIKRTLTVTPETRLPRLDVLLGQQR